MANHPERSKAPYLSVRFHPNGIDFGAAKAPTAAAARTHAQKVGADWSLVLDRRGNVLERYRRQGEQMVRVNG